MRGLLTTAIGILAATATAADANVTCATGLYILCARGSGETQPVNTGSPGLIAQEVAKQVKGSVIAGVIYPATDPTDPTAPGGVNLTVYYPSENTGVKAIMEEVKQYHSSCPDSKIALIGYSQGAQVVQDALCGGIGGPFNSDAPLSTDLVKKNVVAIALMGDPTHLANEPIDRGTSSHDGAFPRPNITVCKQYDDITASWCDKGDPFCDQGDNITVHESYFPKYGTEIAQFVIDKWKNSTSQSDSVSTATGTAGSSPTGTSAGSPTGSPSGLGKNLILGGVMLLAVWLF